MSRSHEPQPGTPDPRHHGRIEPDPDPEVPVVLRTAAVLVVVCAAQFLDIVSLSSVNLALPAIEESLGFSESALAWVITAYALAFAGLLLVGGRLADVLGGRAVLIAGFVLFAVASLGAAVASSPLVLVLARALQGAGAAVTIPAALQVIGTNVPSGAPRDRALAAFAASGAIGFAGGLVLGGVATDTVGWRWIFGACAPVAFLIVLLAAVFLPRTSRRAARRLDLPSAVVSTAGARPRRLQPD